MKKLKDTLIRLAYDDNVMIVFLIPVIFLAYISITNTISKTGYAIMALVAFLFLFLMQVLFIFRCSDKEFIYRNSILNLILANNKCVMPLVVTLEIIFYRLFNIKSVSKITSIIFTVTIFFMAVYVSNKISKYFQKKLKKDVD